MVFSRTLLITLVLASLSSITAQQPFDPQGRPNRNQPGPWDNDVLVYRVPAEGPLEHLATFSRAGVPTLARLADGRLIAAHQHFPEDHDADFDKVAVHFSSDEGRTWTPPAVIQLTGLPDGMRFPFDPTLLPLPDRRVRLYFTSVPGRRIDLSAPAIYSAVSVNGVDFVVEPGMRFGLAGRQVIDSAVVLHRGVYHLFAPDNGPVGLPPRIGGPPTISAPGPRPAVGYHATSVDGLTFTRDDDVRVDGGRRWLGNAQSDADVIRFFGTGGPGDPGIWTATSADGRIWQRDAAVPRVPGADPGAVKARDGAWILAVTGPPRRGRPRQ